MVSLVLALLLPSSARAEIRPHAEASIWGGYLRHEYTGPGSHESEGRGLFVARGALGVAWFSPSGVAVRGGGVLDLLVDASNSAAVGAELQVDADFAPWPGWRLGGRIAATIESRDGRSVVPGLRLRNGVTFVGVDAVVIRRSDGVSREASTGVMFGAGVDGLPAAVVLSTAGLVTATVLLVAVRSLRNNIH